MPESRKDNPAGPAWTLVGLKSYLPADQDPVWVGLFVPNSANEPGLIKPWQTFVLPGGSGLEVNRDTRFEVYATCDMFAPDRPHEPVGRFRSQAVPVLEHNALVGIDPVLGSRGDLIGLRLGVDQGPSDKLKVHAAATLDRPVTVHVLQSGRELFEARLFNPGEDHEFDTSAGFLLGFQVVRFQGPLDLNGPWPTEPLSPQFLQPKELGTATLVEIKGSSDTGITIELGNLGDQPVKLLP